MRILTLFFALAGVSVAESSDLDRLGECLDSVKNRYTVLRARVPAFLFSTQGRFSSFSAGLRKLQHMQDGTKLLEANHQALLSRGLSTPLDRIVTANALEGCRAYDAKSANLAWFLQVFLTFFSGLCAFLTLRIALAIFSGLRSRGPHVDKNSPPSSPSSLPQSGVG